MANRVCDEFADDPQQRVGGVVREPVARHVEPHGQRRSVKMMTHRSADGLVHVLLIKREVAEIPDAGPQLGVAGFERL